MAIANFIKNTLACSIAAVCLTACASDDFASRHSLEGASSARVKPALTTFMEDKRKAEQGDLDAQVFLGFRYSEGRGVKRDRALGRKWYKKAANQGHGMAALFLSDIYRKGIGVKVDNAAAQHWHDMWVDSLKK